MNAEAIAIALGGHKIGGGWMARCPSHVDRMPSLAIRDGHDGKALLHCHAGCDQKQVIAALRSRGLWYENGRRQSQLARRAPSAASAARPNCDDASRSEVALAIWQSTVPADGTLVQTYLQSRGLRLAPPPTLRFHAGLRHPSGGLWPVMISLVTGGVDGKSIAIHRTFLALDGQGKAPINTAKMMLGPCRGGAVRLAEPVDVLLIGEGLETCLAAMQATGHAAWAALSTSGLRTLDLPGSVREVIVLADGDDPGEAAARNAAGRWSCEGRRSPHCLPTAWGGLQ